MFRKSMRTWVSIGLAYLIVFAPVAAAQAATKIVSIKFGPGSGPSFLMNPGDVAGFFPAPNWNNMDAATGVLDGVNVPGQLIDSTGADSNMIFSWGTQGGRLANTPGGGATAGDAKLFSGGREGDINANNQTTAQFKLENLNTAFPNGYQTIWYTGDSSLANQAGFGQVYRTTDDTKFTFNNGASDPPEGDLGTTIVPGNQFGAPNGAAFNGVYTFTANGFAFLDVLLTDDTIVYSFRQKAGGSSFWGLMNVGMQIVGEVNEIQPVPEASTIALATLGFLGLGCLVIRRKFRRRA